MLSKALRQGHNQNASTTLAAALGDSLILVTPLISSITNHLMEPEGNFSGRSQDLT